MTHVIVLISKWCLSSNQECQVIGTKKTIQRVCLDEIHEAIWLGARMEDACVAFG